MKILVLDEAENDLAEGFHFYQSQEEGVGDYFLDSVFGDIESLYLYAGLHEKHFGYYRLLAKRFPVAIYYKVNGQIIQVYAVVDCRRNPAWIKKRLGDH